MATRGSAESTLIAPSPPALSPQAGRGGAVASTALNPTGDFVRLGSRVPSPRLRGEGQGEGLKDLAAERCEGLLAGEIVLCLDVTHGAGLRPHDDRMREGAAGKAAYTAQHRAVCDPSRGKHDIAMRHVEDALFVIDIGDYEELVADSHAVVA